MSIESIDLKWNIVRKSLDILRDQTDRIDSAARLAVISPESPLWEPAHIIGGQLIKAMSLLVDDEFDSISWFVHECDFGRNPQLAGCNGDMRSIDSIEKLRWLIDVDCA